LTTFSQRKSSVCANFGKNGLGNIFGDIYHKFIYIVTLSLTYIG
jgi:hypothetical protein